MGLLERRVLLGLLHCRRLAHCSSLGSQVGTVPWRRVVLESLAVDLFKPPLAARQYVSSLPPSLLFPFRSNQQHLGRIRPGPLPKTNENQKRARRHRLHALLFVCGYVNKTTLSLFGKGMNSGRRCNVMRCDVYECMIRGFGWLEWEAAQSNSNLTTKRHTNDRGRTARSSATCTKRAQMQAGPVVCKADAMSGPQIRSDQDSDVSLFCRVFLFPFFLGSFVAHFEAPELFDLFSHGCS